MTSRPPSSWSHDDHHNGFRAQKVSLVKDQQRSSHWYQNSVAELNKLRHQNRPGGERSGSRMSTPGGGGRDSHLGCVEHLSLYSGRSTSQTVIPFSSSSSQRGGTSSRLTSMARSEAAASTAASSRPDATFRSTTPRSTWLRQAAAPKFEGDSTKRYEGDDFVHSALGKANSGAAMRSTQERFVDPCPFQTQAPEELPDTLAKNAVLKRGNVAFRMNQERWGNPDRVKGSIPHRVQFKTKPAVWSFGAFKDAKKEDKLNAAMKAFREAVSVSSLARWSEQGTAEAMLCELGYDDENLMRVLLDGAPLATVSNAIRKQVEEFRRGLGEKELRGLVELLVSVDGGEEAVELRLGPADLGLSSEHAAIIKSHVRALLHAAASSSAEHGDDEERETGTTPRR